MKLPKNLYRRWIKRIYGFENLTYSQRLKDFYLFSVEERLLRANVIKCWKIFLSKCGICLEDIFVLVWSGIARDYCFKFIHELLHWIVGAGHLV